MSSTPRPHDLVWLNNAAALEAIEESPGRAALAY